MVDFRRMLLLLVVLAFAAGMASAQYSPLICAANAGVPPPVRAEGLAEEVGQVKIECTGGTPVAAGVTIPTINIQIALGTNITSRLIAGGSEAMLLIDEPLKPGTAATAQRLCVYNPNVSVSCPATAATSIGIGNYTGAAAGQENVFQAIRAGDNSVSWLGVPFNPPGTSGTRTMRIVNVRADAQSLGVSSTLIPTPIQMYIIISGTSGPQLTNNVLNVGYVLKGMEFTATGGIWNQCEPGTYTYNLNFRERFGTAFRNNPAGANNQFVPETIYNTESMWSSTGLLASNGSAASVAGIAGYATQGTRLIARFSNVPSGVTLVAPLNNASGIDTATLLTGTDQNGANGSFATGPATVALSGGAGYAVWEVTSSNPGNINTITFSMSVSYGSNPLPGLGVATVTGNYAPTSTVNVMSETAKVPRFVNDPQSATTFEITSCQTNLLFPYITNAAGFDTGISIANTSLDPGWVAPQQGPCTLYYYGLTGAADAPPPSQTSGIIPGGKSLIFTLSNGGGVQGAAASSVLATPNFTGYMIARCNFQYAHGYAFISDLGIRNWAQGYVALVLDQALASRTGIESEVLGN